MTPDMTQGLYALFVLTCLIVLACLTTGFVFWLAHWAAERDEPVPHPDDRLVTQEWLSKTKAEYDAELRD